MAMHRYRIPVSVQAAPPGRDDAAGVTGDVTDLKFRPDLEGPLSLSTGAGRICAAPLRKAAIGVAILAGLALAGCQAEKAELDQSPKFTEQEYQVEASPRVTELKRVERGGGRYQVGKAYKVKGKWYQPKEDPTYAATGLASWYGSNFHGRLTANGEVFDQHALSAAHPTMPLPSYARVTNVENGNSMIVRVNDRGPFAHNRIIDLSARAAKMLGYSEKGVAEVKVEYVGRARMDGHDDKFLLASFRTPGDLAPGATVPGSMLAMSTDAPQPYAEGAIEERVDVALAGAIPVPEERPVNFDGVPLDMGLADDQLLTASLHVSGYRAETADGLAASRFVQAFAALERPAPEQVSRDRAGQTFVIRLARYTDPVEAAAMRDAIGDLGVTSMRHVRGSERENDWEVRLIVGGDVAGSVVGELRRRGFGTAQILSAPAAN